MVRGSLVPKFKRLGSQQVFLDIAYSASHTAGAVEDAFPTPESGERDVELKNALF